MTELLTRKDAAAYLATKGIRSSQSTLARYAMGGNGPQYALIGRTAYYRTQWLDAWLEEQLTPHSHSLAHMLQDQRGGGHAESYLSHRAASRQNCTHHTSESNWIGLHRLLRWRLS